MMPPQQAMPPSLYFSGETQVGFWKTDTCTNLDDAKTGVPCSLPAASAPVTPFNPQPPKCFETPDPLLNFTLQSHAVEAENCSFNLSDNSSAELPCNLWGSTETRCNSWAKSTGISSHYEIENGLFSSSPTELFSRKLSLPSSNAFCDGEFVDTPASHYEEEPFESLKEIEFRTIGNLLPNDDDLLSGMVGGLQHTDQNDVEDLDLFSSVGGMDLGDDTSFAGQRNYGFQELGGTGVSHIGEHPYGEYSSRTLFVRNINSNIEDSELRALFEQYGDIRTLYTACKHRGFVMISYYDIRAARNAMKALLNKPLRRRKIDIHFSIPKDNPSDKDVNQGILVVFNLDSSVSNDDLRKIFGVYGEIKEIRETSHKSSQKFLEFYDVRAADDALRALNRSDIAGKKIKLELCRPGGARWSSMQLLTPELALDDSGLYLPQEFLLDPINGSSVASETGVDAIGGIQIASGPFAEGSLRHAISSSVPNGIPSLLRAELVGRKPGFSECENLVGQMKYDLQGLPSFQHHSLPDYSDGYSTVSPFNSNIILPSSVSSVPSERVENCHLGRIYSSIDMGDGFASLGNGGGSLAWHHCVWSNSKHAQPPAFMWPKPPSFSNKIGTPQSPNQVHGLARSPSHMLNSVLPLNGPHVGSAPAVNCSFWDGRNFYSRASLESSGFHHVSVRSMSNHLHNLDFVSHNLSSHVSGNCMDLPISSRNVGFLSPHQRGMVYPNRGQLNMGGSFESHGERARNHRNESSSCQADNNKQYELDIDHIKLGEDCRTTLMLKNIPNKYTSKMLMAAIDEHHHGTYDFIYLPIDFKNKCNVGYAFINMVDPSHIIPFYENFNGKKWEKFNSEKVASLAYARIQGKTALIAHFQNSSLMNEDKRCRPILFHSDGSNAGDQVPFPMGINIRSRAGKPKSSSNEDNYLENPPNIANNEESSNGDTSSNFGKESD